MQQRCTRSGLPTPDCRQLSRQQKLSVRLPRRRAALQTLAMKTPDGPSVAIVGVSGAVGQEFLRVRVPVCRNRSSCVSIHHHSRVRVLVSNMAILHGSAASLQVLKERDFPYSSMKMLASARCRCRIRIALSTNVMRAAAAPRN